MAADGTGSTPGEAMKSLLENFLACKGRLSRIVGRIVGPDEIEDIVQETFVLSYTASRRQQIKNPQAFMVRVARNAAIDHIKRAENRLNCSLDELEEIGWLAAETGSPELNFQSEERFLAFCRAVSKLPVSCRKVFILKKVYGLSLKEIGQRLGISQSTVEKHVVKGMFMVMEYMLQDETRADSNSGNPQSTVKKDKAP